MMTLTLTLVAAAAALYPGGAPCFFACGLVKALCLLTATLFVLKPLQ
jgi:hypothetical protein